MSGAAAIGDARRLAGFALAGVVVHPATDAASSHAVWEALPPDTVLVILSPETCQHLEQRLAERPELVWAALGE
jgi:vacuolar-type H+-ATPase subunit F/Vma7